MKLTVHGINSRQTIDTQFVELRLTPVLSAGSCPSSVFKPYVRKNLNVGTEVVDVESLQVKCPHLEPIPLEKYSYGGVEGVETILGQDMFRCIHPLEYFDSDRKNTPIAVHVPLGWVLSGPSPSFLGLFSTCFKAVTQRKIVSTKSVVGITWGHTRLINKSTGAPQPTFGQRRSFEKPHTTMDHDITLVCSGLITKLVYRKTNFRL